VRRRGAEAPVLEERRGRIITAPEGAEPSVSSRSAALGDPISQGATRAYQVYYRDPDPNFCQVPTGGRST
jgi:hypothetical protein